MYQQIKDFPFSTKSKRWAPKIDEESSDKILKILDMRSISTRKHEWNFANMEPTSITTHKQ